MKTIIIPTDYSASAHNAAVYALQMASQLKAEKIIFFNAYQAPPILTDATTPVMPVMDIDVLADISTQGMKHFMEGLQSYMSPAILVETKTTFDMVNEAIEEFCEKTSDCCVVMGIAGTTKLEELLIGSTATSAMKHATVPVIIVPEAASYTTLNNLMLACDYKTLKHTQCLEQVKETLKDTGAVLHVVNVYANEDDISADKTYQQQLIQSALSDFNPQFHFVHNSDFVKGINDFVTLHNIDLIITIHKKHGFFDGLFSEGHEKKLAFHSHVPMMSIREA